MNGLQKYKDAGVVFVDENTAYIDNGVIIGKGTVIEPCVYIKGNTKIGENCRIGFSSEITDSVIGDDVTITHSVITESSVGDKTKVGPFAYLRPNSNVGCEVKIGDFVEIKNSNIGDKTKISHLTYVGDADVGKGINFGCGTVVVNYDGKKKYRTVIEDTAFIGCNTNLVSPVRVGEGAFTAAGSTITEDVPAHSLAIARERQVTKEGWAEKRNKETL